MSGDAEPQDYSAMVSALRRQFRSGRLRPAAERIRVLQAVRQMLGDNLELIAQAIYNDIKRVADASDSSRTDRLEAYAYELIFVQNEIDLLLESINTWTKPKKVDKALLMIMEGAEIHYEGKGVVLVIGTWNYPVQMLLAPLVDALAAGNCAVIKPSEISSHTAEVLTRLFAKYVDQDVVRVVNGGVPEVTRLLEVKFDHIFVTGSHVVGQAVYAAAAKQMTPVTLELGGKCPVIVDKAVDIEVAAKRVAWGKFMSCGQTCLAPDYLLVLADVYDAFVTSLRRHTSELYTDDPQTTSAFARIVNTRHFDRLRVLLESTGGRVLQGGQHDRDDLYVAPTLVELDAAGARSDAIMQQEIFGPILPIIKVESVERAIEFVSEGELPLALYIFSTDQRVVEKVLSETQSGGVTVNDVMLHIACGNLPFGGVGASGIGKYHGWAGFESMSNAKAVLRRTFFGEFLLWMRYPPFDASKFSWARVLAPYRALPSRAACNNVGWLLLGLLIAYVLKVVGLW